MTKLLGLAGSIRRESFSKRILKEVEILLGAQATLSSFDIGTLPHYNGDLDGESRPSSVDELTASIQQVDGLFIVTPEYNYAVPGVLKNAIDWVSRPAYKSCLAHKPTAIMSVSPSPVGGARALVNLRQVLGGTVTDVFPHPEFLVAGVHAKFGTTGLNDPPTREHLGNFAKRFVAWVGERSHSSS